MLIVFVALGVIVWVSVLVLGLALCAISSRADAELARNAEAELATVFRFSLN